PVYSRVNMLTASLHEENVVYAVFNPQRSGDFKPYVLKSMDKGKTWTNITNNLPVRGNSYCLKQDHVDPNLLFVGTEFGAFFTTDGGLNWTKLAGLPTVAVYDLDIQKRENDLVAATFGRGFYVLDNYTPLRSLSKANLDKKAHLFPIKDALSYVPADPLGLDGTGFQGHNMWASKNPSFGAVFTLYVKDEYKTLKNVRQEKEQALEKDKKNVTYPTFNDLRKEELDEEAKLIWVISDASGKEVRRMSTAPSKGMSRTTWDLRSNATNPIGSGGNGFLVAPGTYYVSITLVKNGTVEELIAKTPFVVKALNNQTLVAKNPQELAAFRAEVAELNRKVSGAGRLMGEMNDEIELMEKAITDYPNTDISLLKEIKELKTIMYDCNVLMNGDGIRAKHEFEVAPSIQSRLGMVEYQLYDNTAGVSNTHKANKAIVEAEYLEVRTKLDEVIKRVQALQLKLDGVPIPYTKSKENWKEN
ncbi:MAG: glycosyl hydrolase, partial [Crocinitomicaceae bacterium]